jgi:hypothetical protein
MGSAARQHGAYGGEYLRVGLRLCERGGRRLAKDLVKLGEKGATYETTDNTTARAEQFTPNAPRSCLLFIARRPLPYHTCHAKLLAVHRLGRAIDLSSCDPEPTLLRASRFVAIGPSHCMGQARWLAPASEVSAPTWIDLIDQDKSERLTCPPSERDPWRGGGLPGGLGRPSRPASGLAWPEPAGPAGCPLFFSFFAFFFCSLSRWSY